MLTLHKSHSPLGKYMGKLIGGYCTVKHIRNHTGKYFEKKQFATSSRVKVLTKKHPFVVKLDDTIFESLANPSEPSVPELIPSSFTGKWKDIEKILSKDLLVEFCKKYKLSSTGTKKALASRLRDYFGTNNENIITTVSYPAFKKDLFFIRGPNDENLNSISFLSNTKISILENEYQITGEPPSIQKAKSLIDDALTFKTQSFPFKEVFASEQEYQQSLGSLSQFLAESFNVFLENEHDFIHLTAISPEDLNEALKCIRQLNIHRYSNQYWFVNSNDSDLCCIPSSDLNVAKFIMHSKPFLISSLTNSPASSNLNHIVSSSSFENIQKKWSGYQNILEIGKLLIFAPCIKDDEYMGFKDMDKPISLNKVETILKENMLSGLIYNHSHVFAKLLASLNMESTFHQETYLKYIPGLNPKYQLKLFIDSKDSQLNAHVEKISDMTFMNIIQPHTYDYRITISKPDPIHDIQLNSEFQPSIKKFPKSIPLNVDGTDMIFDIEQAYYQDIYQFQLNNNISLQFISRESILNNQIQYNLRLVSNDSLFELIEITDGLLNKKHL